MSEVVFLSNTNIQIASGSPASDGVKVSKLISSPLPEGAVLNGVVMDHNIDDKVVVPKFEAPNKSDDPSKRA